MALFKIGVFSPFILAVNNAFNPKNDPVTKTPTSVAEAMLLAGDSTPNQGQPRKKGQWLWLYFLPHFSTLLF